MDMLRAEMVQGFILYLRSAGGLSAGDVCLILTNALWAVMLISSTTHYLHTHLHAELDNGTWLGTEEQSLSMMREYANKWSSDLNLKLYGENGIFT